MSKMEILGIKIDCLSKKEVLRQIELFLLSASQHHIITLNPEMAVEAQYNEYFKNIINEADITAVDGIGIFFACKFKRIRIPQRIRGVDLIEDICSSEFVTNKKIYLLGAGESVAKKAAEVLRKRYNRINIVGAEVGIAKEITNYKLQITNKFQNSKLTNFSPFDKGGFRGIFADYINYNKSNEALIQRINKAQPDILFVAFGAPKQEIWIYENLNKMPSVKLAIGVGGSFDLISGKIKRAPKLMQNIGMEWFWRLVMEPNRIKRIYNATFKFIYFILTKKEGT